MCHQKCKKNVTEKEKEEGEAFEGFDERDVGIQSPRREQSRQNRFAHYRAESQLKVLQRYMDFFDSSADGIVVVAQGGRAGSRGS